MMTVLVLFSILTITMYVADISRNNVIMAGEQNQSTKAFYAAEAGAEKIMWNIRQDSLDPGDGTGYCTANPADFCFDALVNGDIDECVTVGTCVNESTQELSNDSIYGITFKYDDDGTNATTTLTSLGSFGEINRVVQLKY